jgi:hypothetical protein
MAILRYGTRWTAHGCRRQFFEAEETAVLMGSFGHRILRNKMLLGKDSKGGCGSLA